jgi:homoserine dehydrogenase
MEDSVRKAVAAIKEEGYLVGEPQVIRIERPKEES